MSRRVFDEYGIEVTARDVCDTPPATSGRTLEETIADFQAMVDAEREAWAHRPDETAPQGPAGPASRASGAPATQPPT